MPIRLATRGSALALTQSRWVAARLTALCPELSVELVIIRTEGDADQTRPLSAIGGRGVFVKAIEDALLEGKADFAVHSLKDMPSELPEGLALAAVPEREDPRDVVVLPGQPSGDSEEGTRERGNDGSSTPSLLHSFPPSLHALRHGACVGTSGPRRRAMLHGYRPDLRIADIRGNLDTRLRKLDAGEYDALILAAAGLRRLGLEARISLALAPSISVPAVGQGALGVEARADDAGLLERLALLEHAPTRVAVDAERTALACMGAGCTLPFGAYATLDGEMLSLRGMLADLEGRHLIREEVRGAATDPAALGRRLVDALLAAGGSALLSRGPSVEGYGG